MSLDDYFSRQLNTYNPDLDMTPREHVSDGLVDIIGERDDTPVFVAFGSDNAVYDVGKTMTILDRSEPPRIVQYVSREAHSIVVETMQGHYGDAEAEYYAASDEHGTTRFTSFGSPSSDETTNTSLVSLLLDQYTSSEKEKAIVEQAISYVYNEKI